MSVNPNSRILQYPRIKKSPFFHASRQHGVAMYSVYNHRYHPRHYGDPVAEYWALRNGVTLWDVGVERQVEVTGPDASRDGVQLWDRIWEAGRAFDLTVIGPCHIRRLEAGIVPATVVPKPFVDPTKDVPKQSLRPDGAAAE